MRASKVCIFSLFILSHIANMLFILYFKLVAAWDVSEHCDVLAHAMAAGFLRVDTKGSSKHPVLARVVLSASSAIPNFHWKSGIARYSHFHWQSMTSMEVGDCQ